MELKIKNDKMFKLFSYLQPHLVRLCPLSDLGHLCHPEIKELNLTPFASQPYDLSLLQ